MMFGLLKQCLNKAYFEYIFNRRKKGYLRDYKEIINCHPELSLPAEGEEQWLHKWQRYNKSISPLSYRIFSRYIGPDINIIPLELCANMVESVLNPSYMATFYQDKNSFGLLYDSKKLPKTYIHCIDGKYYDENYKYIKGCISDYLKVESFVIKPSRGSSGKGVQVFNKIDDKYIDSEGKPFVEDTVLDAYKKNFIIQEKFVQSDYMSNFNFSSVNTIRISTYRDVNSGEIKYLRGLVRIGGKGAVVDNAHAGGRFIGVDDNGVLGKYLCDNLGRTYKEHNEIDFSKQTFIIPNYENIKKFACEISSKFIHHGLFALDIVLDKENNPKMLEVNIGGFSAWLFQFTSGTAFREYTDEILDYCYNNKHKLKFKIRNSLEF